MDTYKTNYKNQYDDLTCELCSLHIDSQEEAVNCPKIKSEEDTDEENLRKYWKVFDDDIPVETITLIMNINKARNKEEQITDQVRHKCKML